MLRMIEWKIQQQKLNKHSLQQQTNTAIDQSIAISKRTITTCGFRRLKIQKALYLGIYTYTLPVFLDQELISYRYSFLEVLVLAGGISSQKSQGSIVSNRIELKFGRIVLRVNTHRLSESDF